MDLRVTCPHCSAAVGEVCGRPGGGRMSLRSHKAREEKVRKIEWEEMKRTGEFRFERHLSCRLYNVLDKNKLDLDVPEDRERILQMSTRQMLRLRGFGSETLRQLDALLADAGLYRSGPTALLPTYVKSKPSLVFKDVSSIHEGDDERVESWEAHVGDLTVELDLIHTNGTHNPPSWSYFLTLGMVRGFAELGEGDGFATREEVEQAAVEHLKGIVSAIQKVWV